MLMEILLQKTYLLCRTKYTKNITTKIAEWEVYNQSTKRKNRSTKSYFRRGFKCS